MANEYDSSVSVTEAPPTSVQTPHLGSFIRRKEGQGPEEAAGSEQRPRVPRSEPERGLRWTSVLLEIHQTPGGFSACAEHVQREARDLRDMDGTLALEHFPMGLCAHRVAIIQRAFERICGDELAEAVTAPRADAYFRHLVRSEAFAWTDERITGAGAALALSPAARAALELLRQARCKVKRLSGLQQRLLSAFSALDTIASEREATRVMLTGAVAFEMRRNTAHQHISRARAKLFELSGDQPKDDWKHAWKYVLKPTTEQSRAAREYLDMCQNHEGGLKRWTDAHEAHNECCNTSKKRSRAATAAWKAFVRAMGECRLQPRDVDESPLRWSLRLGVDAQVVPQKIAQIRWNELLHPAKRPSKKHLPAWESFLDEHPFGEGILIAFRAFQAAADLAGQAKAALDAAYDELLSAALATPPSFTHARTTFRNLARPAIEAVRG